MSNAAASWVTGASPSRSWSRIARRVGSATARKGSAWAAGRGTRQMSKGNVTQIVGSGGAVSSRRRARAAVRNSGDGDPSIAAPEFHAEARSGAPTSATRRRGPRRRGGVEDREDPGARERLDADPQVFPFGVVDREER